MSMNRWPAVFLILAMIAGCQESQPQDEAAKPDAKPRTVASTDRQDPKQIAVAAKNVLFKRLSTRLKEAMSDGGPTAAIAVCSREAPQIAKSVGKECGVTIGRTSFKLRNPKNLPPDWARPLVEKRSEKPQFIDLPGGGTGALLPIKLKKQCLACHGLADQIANDVKAKLAEFYPNDQATGFKEGDLRGWFWVEVANQSGKEMATQEESWDGTIVQYGQMHEVIGQQKHEGRILLKESVKRPHFYAVGAMEELGGEVTVLDGKVFAAEVESPNRIVPIDSAYDKKAALLVGSHVPAWTDYEVSKSIGHQQFDRYVEDTATSAGIDTSKPFVFTINGELRDLEMHVIQGACPVHAKRAGITLPESKQPYRGSFEKIQGTLVGVFAKNAAGNITHPGTSTHAHVIFEDAASGHKLTGHVEHVGVAAGSVLRLPRQQHSR